MKRTLALVLAFVMVISMMPLSFVSAQTTDRVANLVESMSLRDKVTQMLMVDFRYWDEDLTDNVGQVGFTVMNDQVRKIVEDYNFGALIYFAQNVVETEQTFNLTMEMQKAATKDGGIAMLISADQEGGNVYRLGTGTALPGNMALGATYGKHGTKYALEAGRIIGSELAALGINTDLAPVVDVNNNPNNPVIGLRSYSDNATIVGNLAAASIAGMAEYNVIGCAKHFPGHGDTATDSHYGLPVVDKPLDVLKETELKPYEVAIEQGIEMIMTAHILYPQLEGDKIVSNKTGQAESLPATMSDDILTGLLKEDMGFEGIIITDAMNMAGIADKWDQVQSVVIAISAGVDMVCMPCVLYNQEDLADLDAIINGVIAAVEDGTIPMERIDDAVTRILTVKENRGILDWNENDYSLEHAKETVGGTANRAMEREIAAAAVTVVKNENQTLPLQLTSESKVLMLVPYNNETSQMLMAWNRAKEAGLIPEGAQVDYYRFSNSTINDALKAKLDWADTYIINSEVSSTARMEYKHWLSAMPNKLCDYAKENGKTAIISSVDKPYDVQMYPNASAIVAAYGCKGSSVDPTEALVGGATGSEAAYGPNIIAAVEVILGTYEATGRLPVTVPVYDKESNTYTDEVAYRRGYGLSYKVDKLLSEMSLRDKVTQMLMVDFRYWDEDLTDNVGQTGFTVMNDQVREIVEDYNFGALIYFAQNVVETEQTFNLTMEMQKAATKDGGIAMLISADQEGGNVYRLGTGTALPGNMALGATYATHGTKYALEAGRIIGSELAALGINTDLAPVVDVNNNPNNPVIGLRSYSDDANIVGSLAAASIAGMAEYNVIGCAKHFPGHGDTATDSHYGLPIVDKSLDVLKDVELKPYEVAIEQGIEMIMTAHILYPQLEGDKIVSNKTGQAESLPATMSDDILTGLLKEDMGFEGIIITDAMNMAGIADKWDQVQSVVIAISAGVDMVCMPCVLYNQEDLADLDAIINGVIAAVEDGTIPMSRIDDAVTRILTVKENRGILDWNENDYSLEHAKETVGGTANRAMEREIAAAAVTVVKNENQTLPLQLTSESKVLMLVPYDNERSQMIMAWNRAKEAGLIPEGAQVDYYRFNSATITDALKAKLDWADTYIINSEVSSTARMEYKHWLSAGPNAFCDYAKENGKTAIISSVDKPYDVQMYPNASAIVAAYGCKGSSVDPTEALVGGATGSEAAYGPNIIAAVEVILGTFGATGKLPVTVPVYDKEANTYTDAIAYERGYGLTYEKASSRVDQIMNEMSLRDKVTQMLMVDFRYWDEDLTDNVGQVGFTTMNDQVRKIVEDYNFGALIYFAQNVVETEQTFNLTMEMQKAATKDGGIAMLISADQEGGNVYRLGTGTALPGNMALGATYATHGTKYALEAGRIIGSELAALGINTDLAPVVDVNNNPNNPVIGLRSYSDNADIVGNLASAAIAGMAEYNVIGCAKHFPGHGDTATDSHYGLPVVDKPLDVLLETELKPYEVAIDQGIEMIMTAHILYPQLEGDKILSNKTGELESLPATMSDDILTGLLKGEMGFEGIVITDAMNMAGISSKWDQVQSVVIAISAGVDMVCMPCTLYNLEDLADLDAIIDGVMAAVEDGTIPMSRINDAVKRILTVKENRGILDWSEEDYSIEKAKETVGGTANRAMEREIAAAAVTVVKNENNTLPLNLTETSKVLMLVPYNNERAQMLMAWNRAKEACLIPAGAQVDYLTFNSSATIDSMKEKLEWADIYIINSEISSTARMEYKHWLSSVPNAVCDYAAANGKTAIISSVDKPYDVQMYPNASAIVAAYGCKGSSVDPTEALVGGVTGSEAAYGPNIIAAVEVILGTYAATGKLPVTVPVYNKEANTYTDAIAYERGYGLTYEKKETSSHQVDEWTIVTEATCTEDGLKTGTCVRCGATETVVIPALGHNHVAVVTEPTCTEPGYTTYTCDRCGDTYVADEVPATGHTFGEWVVTTEATCTEDGVETRTCHCGETETRPIPASCASDVYDDVPVGTWFHDAVDYMTESGLMNGMTLTHFGPELTTNRAMMATLLYRMAGEPSTEGLENPFVDVHEDQWFYNAVVWAGNSGIVKGISTTTFCPGDNVNRAQMVAMLYRYAGSPAANADVLEDFTDVETIPNFARAAFAWAIENGIVNGMGNNELAPMATTNRAQIAVLLTRYLTK